MLSFKHCAVGSRLEVEKEGARNLRAWERMGSTVGALRQVFHVRYNTNAIKKRDLREEVRNTAVGKVEARQTLLCGFLNLPLLVAQQDNPGKFVICAVDVTY